MKVVRLKKCECFFTYVEEFYTSEHAIDPDKRGLFIKVKVGAIRVNSVSIRQKEDKYDEHKTIKGTN